MVNFVYWTIRFSFRIGVFMSGGYFDYRDNSSLLDFVNGIRVVIHDNFIQKKVLNDFYNIKEDIWEKYETWEPVQTSDQFGTDRWVRDYRLTQEQIKLLEDVIFDCEILRKKLHSIDWCFSDDIGTEDMEKELKALTKKQIKRYSK